jgi:hypothetical protein
VSDASLRLQRAMDQDAAIKSRVNSPYERVAGVESMCPVCRVIILPGDKIASPANVVMSWRHLGCAICRQCGAWLTAEGACGDDCTVSQSKPEEPLGSWHDLSVTFTAPARAFALLYSEATAPSDQRKLLLCCLIGIRKLAEPPRATTMLLMRAHLQFFITDATSPGRGILMQEAAKNIGLILGNEYVYWDAVKVAFDIGEVSISDEQVLSRPPAWALQNA